MLRLADVLKNVIAYEGVSPQEVFYGACHDHRLLKEGEIFLAFPGQFCHGVTFAEQALIEKKALTVMVTPEYADKFQGSKVIVQDIMVTLNHLARVCRQAYPHPIVAVTGTCGKTSFKEIFASLFQEWHCFKSFANWNNELGLMINLSRLRAEHRYCVFELGISQIGDMDALVDLLRPEKVVITSLGPAHLEGLGSLDTIVEEKQKIAQWASFRYCSLQAAALLQQPEWISVGVNSGKSFIKFFDLDKQVELLENEQVYLSRSLTAPFRWQPELLALALKVAIDLVEHTSHINEHIILPVSAGRGDLIQIGPLKLLDETYNSNPLSLKNLIEFLESKGEPSLVFFGDMLELGEYEQYYQNSIADLIKKMSYIHPVYIGNQYQRWQNLGITAFHADQKKDILNQVSLFRGNLIAFKASRSVGFEYWLDVVKNFLQTQLISQKLVDNRVI